MKRLLILTALLPFVGFAQPINTLNNLTSRGIRSPVSSGCKPKCKRSKSSKRMLNQQLKNANSVATTAFRKPDKQ